MLYRSHRSFAAGVALCRSRVTRYSSSVYSNSNSGSKGLNMNILPGEGYSIPEEASLQGWALVNKRAANMVFTVYGEKPMTKLLQIGGSPAFVDSLGSSTKYDISACTDSTEEADFLKDRKQFSSVDLLPTEERPVTLPYRLASFEMIAYLQPAAADVSAAQVLAVPLRHVTDLLAGRGCCIVGGRASAWKSQQLLPQLEALAEAGVADIMSLQTVECGPDAAPFNEYPGDAQFREEEALRAEHGDGVDDLGDIIVDCPVTRPYYIALVRKR